MSSQAALKLKEQYLRRLNGALRAIEVPEWDMVIYVRPITMRQLSLINAEGDDPFRVAVRTLMVRALDEEGKHLFKKIDMDELLDLPGAERDIVSIVGRINEDLLEPTANP